MTANKVCFESSRVWTEAEFDSEEGLAYRRQCSREFQQMHLEQGESEARKTRAPQMRAIFEKQLTSERETERER
jgi:hypothetical protein